MKGEAGEGSAALQRLAHLQRHEVSFPWEGSLSPACEDCPAGKESAALGAWALCPRGWVPGREFGVSCGNQAGSWAAPHRPLDRASTGLPGAISTFQEADEA